MTATVRNWCPGQSVPTGPAVRPRHPLAQAVAADPLLRTHCVVATDWAVPERWTAFTLDHPVHRDHSYAVDLDLLLRSGVRDQLAERLSRLFQRAGYGPDSGFGPVGHVVEYLVRPLATVVRVLLDHSAAAASALATARLGVELSPESVLTGRILLWPASAPPSTGTDGTAHPDSAAESPTDATGTDTATVLRALRARAEVLAAAAAQLAPADPQGAREQVLACVDTELDALAPATVQRLDTAARSLLPTGWVSPGQDRLLRQVLDRVAELARAGRRPAVVVDVDLCGLAPHQRTAVALAAAAAPRPGAPTGLPELADAATLPLLPVHHQPGWEHFTAVTGLADRYPELDLAALRSDFEAAYYRPWENLATDRPAPGLPWFAAQVVHLGGEVVFNTARRDRVRLQTEQVLHEAGLHRARLLTMPDDRTRPIAELKVEQLRALAGLEVVAVFDDLAENRQALAAAHPEALSVAVELSGFAHQRGLATVTADRAPVVTGFGLRAEPAPTLSKVASAHRLRLERLRPRRPAQAFAVWLDETATARLAERLAAAADTDAAHTADGVRRHLGGDGGPEGTVRALHRLLTRSRFLKGSRANYPPSRAEADLGAAVAAGEPVRLTAVAFPFKQQGGGLKAEGPGPDLAELAALVRLRELSVAIGLLYPPGATITVLTDGQHFQRRPAAITEDYQRTLHHYLGLTCAGRAVDLLDLDRAAAEQLPAAVWATRPARFLTQLAGLRRRLADLEVTERPLLALAAASARAHPDFERVFRSLAYAVPVPVPTGVDRVGWAVRVYADLFNLVDPGAGPRLLADRRRLLSLAWERTVRYLAVAATDEGLGYERLLAPRVRLTNSPRPGGCGFGYLGGTALLPWQGTGALDAGAHPSVDFAVWLRDQGFVPVHTPLLGADQPWAMVPATAVLTGGGRPPRLDPDFLAAVRLRRR